VIAMASVFLAQELFVARGREQDKSFLAGLMLMVQFVAFVGALVFERIAAVVGAKRALLFSLVAWSGTIVYAIGSSRPNARPWSWRPSSPSSWAAPRRSPGRSSRA